jgi:excisionase family DNA binding protein
MTDKPKQLMTPNEISTYWKVPKSTLYRWHSLGIGPRAIKVGKHLRYRCGEVERWLDEQAEMS